MQTRDRGSTAGGRGEPGRGPPARARAANCRTYALRWTLVSRSFQPSSTREQNNAVIKRVSKHAAGIQMGFSPCINRAWNDVASKSASRDGPIDLIVIQYSLAHDKKIVIAL